MKIVLIGKSASGKDRICNLITENLRYDKIVSGTTRPIRNNEVDEKDYFFVTDEEFNKLETDKKILDSVKYNKWSYGVLKKDFDEIEDGILISDPIRLRKTNSQRKDFISIYIRTKDEDRFIRQIKRGDALIEIAMRHERDEISFQGIEQDVDFIVSNNNEDWDCVREILNVIQIAEERNIK